MFDHRAGRLREEISLSPFTLLFSSFWRRYDGVLEREIVGDLTWLERAVRRAGGRAHR